MNQPTIEQVLAAIHSVLSGKSPVSTNPIEGSFSGRLLSLRHAEILAREVREIRIAEGTVITPLAREFLKKQQVSLQVVSDADLSLGEWGFAVENDSGTNQALKRILKEGPVSWSDVGRTATEAANWVVSAPNRGAAVLTDQAAVAVWKANAVNGTRAAQGFDLDSTARAVQLLGVNLLVVETREPSIPFVKQILRTFRRGGPPSLPSELSATRIERTQPDEDRRSDRPSHPVEKAYGPAERALRDRLAHAAIGTRRGLGGSG